jgi:hypothetical protein
VFGGAQPLTQRAQLFAVRPVELHQRTLPAFVLAVLLLTAAPASAQGEWEAPPRCVTTQWHRDGKALGLYQKVDEYKKTRVTDTGTEVDTIWIFFVDVVHYPQGLLTVGRAEKTCRTEWFPDYSDIA